MRANSLAVESLALRAQRGPICVRCLGGRLPDKGQVRMVKMLFFLKRRPDLSAAEFHRYWSEQHGPLFANSAAARRYVVRYEQHHTAPENGDVGGLEFDGFSVM